MGSDPIAILAGHQDRLAHIGEKGGGSERVFRFWNMAVEESGVIFSVAICGVLQRALCSSCLDIYVNDVISENKHTCMPTLWVKTNQT